MRWKIEVCRKILKSGCMAEESKLRIADRLVNLIALFCILQLAHLLADHAEPDAAGRTAPHGID